MFRFVSTNAQQGIRPVLLQNLRNNSGIVIPNNTISNSTSVGIGSGSPSSLNNNGLGFYNSRFNSYSTRPVTKENYDDYIEKLKDDSTIKLAIKDETKIKLNYFKEQLVLFKQYKKLTDKNGQMAFSATCHNIIQCFDDAELRSVFNRTDLHNYIHALNFSIYHNRTNRLTSNKNIDKDQYSSTTSIDQNILKDTLLKLYNIILSGELKHILSVDSIVLFFNAMNQFQFYNESIDVWELGVNDSKYGADYLNDKVLAVIFPIAYKINRFSYEEILRIYELNTSNSSAINPLLLCSMGKISISAGDYARGLDILETVIKLFENSDNVDAANYYLGDLHIAFIGSAKDITISKHFFDKVITYDLPYTVKLKVPYVQSLLENCVQSGESFDTIHYFWKSTISHYKNDTRVMEINSRYAILNNTFFKIFYQLYPTLTPESFNKLKEIINSYNEVKGVDEVFLNTLISNYSWNDKAVFDQLLENYLIFNVDRTQVSYRVCLKKIGDIGAFTNEEILQKWNDSLISLDQKRFRYIPKADWASIRDATVTSENYHEHRSELYWQIVGTYRNCFQDFKNCAIFIKNWLRHDTNKLAEMVGNKYPPVESPPLNNLTESVDFNQVWLSISSQVNNKKR